MLSPRFASLDRYTTMGELTQTAKPLFRRLTTVLLVLSVTEVGFLFLTNSPGTFAFGAMALSTVIAMFVWNRNGCGTPLFPILVLQHLTIYALPIVSDHPDIHLYSPAVIGVAGTEVFVFIATMTIVWWGGMELIRSSPSTAFVLLGVDREGVVGLSRVGFALIASSTAFLVAQGFGWIDFIFEILPTGTFPIIRATVSAMGACGFFIGGIIVATKSSAPWFRALFWALLAVNCVVSAGGFLLSAATTSLASVLIGLFWGTGRVPWRFTIVVVVLLSFFNIGKAAMRDRYWRPDDDETTAAAAQTLWDLPQRYTEWSEVSFDGLLGRKPRQDKLEAIEGKKAEEAQSLIERINNLSNLLFVIDAMDAGAQPLHGETYAIIPKLLVPRIMTPDKVRSHEGQVLLNVHFGRQDLNSTFTTYIAWGLLPEAYGNFGRFTGAILLGAVLGALCAWLERVTAQKPVLSLEGLLSFVVLLAMVNSFEMVASVLVTSIYQAIIPTALACIPFVRYMNMRRPSVVDDQSIA